MQRRNRRSPGAHRRGCHVRGVRTLYKGRSVGIAAPMPATTLTRRPARLSLALLVLAVCFYALLIAASLSIQTDSTALPLEHSSLRASPRHARQQLPSKPAEQPSSPPPPDPPPSLPSSPRLPRYPPPPPPSQPLTQARHLPRRFQPSFLAPSSSASSLPPPSPTPTLPPPPLPTLPPPPPASADSSAPHPKGKSGRHAHGKGEQHGKAEHGKGGDQHGKGDQHGHGRPRRFVPQASKHGWEEASPQRRLRVAVRRHHQPMHRPFIDHAYTMRTPCVHHACTGRTPCMYRAYGVHVPCRCGPSSRASYPLATCAPRSTGDPPLLTYVYVP